MSSHATLLGPIVVVDDQAENNAILLRALRHLVPGAEIVAARHGAGVLVQIESRRVPLVVTDYHMPDMDGAAVVREVKERSPQTYVAVLTGDTNDEVRHRLHAAGADLIINKPFMLADLAGLLEAALRHSRAAA